MDTDSFIVHLKTERNNKDIAEDVETMFGILNQTGHFLKEKIKKRIRLMKDKLGRKVMKKFVRLSAKRYSYLKENNNEVKKAKSRNRCFMKRKLKL